MLSDYKINKNAKLLPIAEVAHALDLSDDDIELYGKYKAKINLATVERLRKNSKPSKLILVTAITPTPHGEGKSTITIGLGDALHSLGKKAVIALREPSLGPCFGIKGGATGGGYTQVAPMEDINLHFNGDFHAITSANNLLASVIDNHIYHGNVLQIDPTTITFKRCVDLNDRALRKVTVGGDKNGVERLDGFNITVASEIMAIFCLSRNVGELKNNLGNIMVAKDLQGKTIYARDLKVVGAMSALLAKALAPNLVQTLAHTPALIHGGPFANIAHGCNSIIATQTALALGEYVVTEAGFAADLGAEKFMNIKCRNFDLVPSAVVLVATTRGLALNGADNLKMHIENLKKFGVNIVVAINHFVGDAEEDLKQIEEIAASYNVSCARSYGFEKGGEGVQELAFHVMKAASEPNQFKPLYSSKLSIKEKIEFLAREIYRAARVEFSETALHKLERLEITEVARYPICMAKTQNSLTDDGNIKGDPTTQNYTFHVRDLSVSNGAGFIVVYAGSVMTMPGLPSHPNAEVFNVDDLGNLTAGFDK
jgi:formate--tetrahydrofolate ligase